MYILSWTIDKARRVVLVLLMVILIVVGVVVILLRWEPSKHTFIGVIYEAFETGMEEAMVLWNAVKGDYGD